MLNKWRKVKLGEIASLIDSLHITPTYSLKGVPIVRVKDIREGFLNLETCFKVDELIFEKYSKKYKAKQDDIIFSRVGSEGISTLVKFNQEFCLGQNTVSIIPKNVGRWLYYWLISPYGKEQIKKATTGSTQNTISLKSINNLEIIEPPLNEQQTIAQILSSLDDKIDLLREENKTLESVAQLLFNRWFIDFEFPNEEGNPYKSSGGKMVNSDLKIVPVNWKVVKLTNIASFLNGVASQKYPVESNVKSLPVIKIRELNAGISDKTDYATSIIDNKYIINSGDVIFSWSGSLELTIWKYEKGILNQHLFKVSSQTFPKWFYFYWILHHLDNFKQIAKSKSVTMGHIQRHHLEEAKVLLPNEKCLNTFNNFFSKVINKIIDNNSQIDLLNKLKDILLPKLISGNILK